MTAPRPHDTDAGGAVAGSAVAGAAVAGGGLAGGARAASPLRADGVSYARGGRVILDAVTFTAEPGRVTGVVGPSGSGKSSLLALLAGLEQPDSGLVHRACDERGRALDQGLILQGYGLISVLTASENVELPLQTRGGTGLTRDRIRARAEAWIGRLGLAAVADHLVEELSGGQQQRVAVARALVAEPHVLLADELTAELDHDWKAEVMAAVFEVARAGGTVVVATHDPDIASRCDRVLRLAGGTLAR